MTTGTIEIRLEQTVTQIDDDKHLAFGWANVFIRTDGTATKNAHGDIVDSEHSIELFEDAVYEYVIRSGSADKEHKQFGMGTIVESFLVTSEKLLAMGAPADALPTGWWVGFHIEDEGLWRDIKSGKLRMLSIVGKGRRVPRAT